MSIKLIISMRELKSGDFITKKTGTKLYQVQDEITLDTQPPTKIQADEETRFIVPVNTPSAYINAISSDTEVVWLTNKEEIQCRWAEEAEEFTS